MRSGVELLLILEAPRRILGALSPEKMLPRTRILMNPCCPLLPLTSTFSNFQISVVSQDHTCHLQNSFSSILDQGCPDVARSRSQPLWLPPIPLGFPSDSLSLSKVPLQSSLVSIGAALSLFELSQSLHLSG